MAADLSPAMQALYEGDRARAEQLLPPDDELTVFEAAAFGRVDALRAILDGDPAQANALSPDGFTPLHLACFAGGPTATQLLVERGADLERISEAKIAQVRPLGTAVFSGDRASAKILLEAGANANGPGSGGSTPLQAAEANGDEEMIHLLKSYGADAGSAGVG
jgi:ankyrin repeat protein